MQSDIEQDVAAAERLLTWLRANHYVFQGSLVVGKIHIAGLIDEDPRRILARKGKESHPVPDDMEAFR